jgi:hypothetical protein
VLTILSVNSLLTGKNTGNFSNFWSRHYNLRLNDAFYERTGRFDSKSNREFRKHNREFPNAYQGKSNS